MGKRERRDRCGESERPNESGAEMESERGER